MCEGTSARVVRRAATATVSARASRAWRRAKSGASAAARQVGSWKWRWRRAPSESDATLVETTSDETRDDRPRITDNDPVSYESRCVPLVWSKVASRGAGRLSRRFRREGKNKRAVAEETTDEKVMRDDDACVEFNDAVQSMSTVQSPESKHTVHSPRSSLEPSSPTSPYARSDVPGAVASPLMSPAKIETPKSVFSDAGDGTDETNCPYDHGRDDEQPDTADDTIPVECVEEERPTITRSNETAKKTLDEEHSTDKKTIAKTTSTLMERLDALTKNVGSRYETVATRVEVNEAEAVSKQTLGVITQEKVQSPSPVRLLVKRVMEKTKNGTSDVYTVSDSDDDELVVTNCSVGDLKAATVATPGSGYSRVESTRWSTAAQREMEPIGDGFTSPTVSPDGVTVYRGLPLLTHASEDPTVGWNKENVTDCAPNPVTSFPRLSTRGKWSDALRNLPTFQDVARVGSPKFGKKSLLMRKSQTSAEFSILTQSSEENESEMFAALEQLVEAEADGRVSHS